MSEQRKQSEKRRRWTAKAKMEVVLEGLKGEETIAELCRRHGITQSMYYEWQETMLTAGLEGLTHSGKSSREAELEKQLKQAERTIGRLTMENELYQKKTDWIAARRKKPEGFTVRKPAAPPSPTHAKTWVSNRVHI